ncbi:MAG: GDP-mannose 4,6-dehydratase [Vulcanimicrobiaceae bacterium]
MRALLTGAGGFVGAHLLTALQAAGDEVFACGGPRDAGAYFSLDLADLQNLRAALDLARPEVVFHLAGQAFVPAANADPLASYDVNALGTARLLAAVRGYRDAGNPAPRLVLASSADVYGMRDPGDLPFREELALRPVNPYAASKAAAEMIALAEARTYDLDVRVARGFNQIGPGQSDVFAIASFAGQLARIAAGAPARMAVGNLDVRRDMLDVRDAAQAYLAIASAGCSGEVYNVCSGRATSLREMLGELIRIAGVAVEVRNDPARMRSVEMLVAFGSYEKLATQTGWRPRTPLAATLADIYADACVRIAASKA